MKPSERLTAKSTVPCVPLEAALDCQHRASDEVSMLTSSVPNDAFSDNTGCAWGFHAPAASTVPLNVWNSTPLRDVTTPMVATPA
jgi:hypothetical protein